MEPMKKSLVKGMSILAGVGLLLGCSAKGLKIVMLDTTKRAPTEKVDIFTSSETTKKSIKDIAELSLDGAPGTTEEEALKVFVSEAKKLGAQVLVTENPAPRVVQHGDFGRETFYVFRARLAIYE
jgi:hypothetical protein